MYGSRESGALQLMDAYLRLYGHPRLLTVAEQINGPDARQQRFPQERPYLYEPLAGELDDNRWSESTRESILKNYDTKTIGGELRISERMSKYSPTLVLTPARSLASMVEMTADSMYRKRKSPDSTRSET